MNCYEIIIKHINENNIKEICEYFNDISINNDIFKKKILNLFNKNTKFLKYFRGVYYINDPKNFNKSKTLMKYNNPFIYLLHHFGLIYLKIEKYNKSKFYLKIKKYLYFESLSLLYLSIIYFKKEQYMKYFIYYFKVKYEYNNYDKKYFISIILI